MGNQGSVLNEKDWNRFMKIHNSILALTWKITRHSNTAFFNQVTAHLSDTGLQ